MVGTVVVSLDAELAWGFHDAGHDATDGEQRGDGLRTAYARLARGEHPPHQFTTTDVDTTRRSWHGLLDAFDEFGVPATWAVVGHLFLDECDGEHRSHPLAPAWFANDPGGSAADNRAWFADGLIAAIENRDTDHEIGSHSFSHVDFGASETTPAVAAAEHRAADAAAAAHDIDLTSFVFPRNQLGHLDRLAEHDFTCYRGQTARWYDGSALRPAGKLATMLTQRSAPPVSHPSIDEHGLVDVPASLYLFGFEGVARSWTRRFVDDPLVRQVKLGVERAIAEDGVFHLWFHPNDVRCESHLDRVRKALAYVADRRDRGDVTTATMSTVARRVRGAAEQPNSA